MSIYICILCADKSYIIKYLIGILYIYLCKCMTCKYTYTIWVWVKIEYPSYWMVNTENRLKPVVPQVLNFDPYPYTWTCKYWGSSNPIKSNSKLGANSLNPKRMCNPHILTPTAKHSVNARHH